MNNSSNEELQNISRQPDCIRLSNQCNQKTTSLRSSVNVSEGFFRRAHVWISTPTFVSMNTGSSSIGLAKEGMLSCLISSRFVYFTAVLYFINEGFPSKLRFLGVEGLAEKGMVMLVHDRFWRVGEEWVLIKV